MTDVRVAQGRQRVAREVTNPGCLLLAGAEGAGLAHLVAVGWTAPRSGANLPLVLGGPARVRALTTRWRPLRIPRWRA
jgi:hypothetical protein